MQDYPKLLVGAHRISFWLHLSSYGGFHCRYRVRKFLVSWLFWVANRFFDPFFESPVNYWPRKAVLFIGQGISFNSLSDDYKTVGLVCLLGPALCYLDWFQYFGFGPVTFRGLRETDPSTSFPGSLSLGTRMQIPELRNTVAIIISCNTKRTIRESSGSS